MHAGPLRNDQNAVVRVLTLPYAWRFDKKRSVDHAAPRAPAKGQNRTAPAGAPFAGRSSKYCFCSSRARRPRFADLLGSRNLTLARRSIVFGVRHPAALIIRLPHQRCGHNPSKTHQHVTSYWKIKPAIQEMPPMSTIRSQQMVGFCGGYGVDGTKRAQSRQPNVCME